MHDNSLMFRFPCAPSPINHRHLSSDEFKWSLLSKSHNVLERLSLLLIVSAHTYSICVTTASFKQAYAYFAQTPAHCWVCCLSNYTDWTMSHFFPLPTQTSNRIHLNYCVKCNQIGNRSLTEIWFSFSISFHYTLLDHTFYFCNAVQ